MASATAAVIFTLCRTHTDRFTTNIWNFAIHCYFIIIQSTLIFYPFKVNTLLLQLPQFTALLYKYIFITMEFRAIIECLSRM